MKNKDVKIAVIGATGFVGAHIVSELVRRNYKVLGISRNGQPRTEAVTYIGLDIFNTKGLAAVLSGYNIAISAFNPGWLYNSNIYDEYICGAYSIQRAAKIAGVKRLIIVGGAGSLYVAEGVQLVDTENFPAEIRLGAAAARDYLNVLKSEDEIDWAFFSPAKEMHAGITAGRTGKYRLGTDFPVIDEQGRSVLSVEDVAVVIADEIEMPKHHKVRFTAAY